MAPHGAIGSPSLVRYGSHSLLEFCKMKNKLLDRLQRHLNSSLFVPEEAFSTIYLQCSPVAIQLTVVPGLHVTSVVLIEVG